MTVRCVSCGKELDEVSRFCGQCGTKVGSAPRAPKSRASKKRRSVGKRRVEVHEHNGVDATIDLAAIGIPSRTKIYSVIALTIASLVAAGALGAWAMRDEPEPDLGHASPDAEVMIASVVPDELAPDLPPGAPSVPPAVGPAVGPAVTPTVTPTVPATPTVEAQAAMVETPAAMTTETMETVTEAREVPSEMTTEMTLRRTTVRRTRAVVSTAARMSAEAATSTTTMTASRVLPPPSTPTEPEPRYVSAAAYSASARTTVARRHTGDVQRCFDAATRTEPTLSGTVLIGLMMRQDGQVVTGRVVQNTTGHAAIGTCLTRAARSWRLPPPPPRAFEFQISFSR